ncbi:MAG: ETC complex I subunit [Candidatus Paracaedimonas acanthamoebae]|uniref:ETC complex I subunit n=1 Tax=Candidatus Paracaedimonas acanthamoebae TaxID=244581 RepID=A0A8J7PJG1_9PROT|nr:ETC complex I subunit [Candidatus Paracaedimonas acanthamoebae]
MADVRIYKQKKSAMQSGLRRTRNWVLEFIQPAHLYIEPLMKWAGSIKTNSEKQRLFFETSEMAIAYARSKNLTYFVENSSLIKVIPKRYSDNFKRL